MCVVEIARELREADDVAIDYETYGEDSLTPFLARKRGVALAWRNLAGEEKAVYFSFLEESAGGYTVSWDWFVSRILKKLWTDPKKRLIFHNAKFDLQITIAGLYGRNLKAEDIPGCLPLSQVHDTMIMSWLLDENLRVSLKELSKIRLDKPRKTYKAVDTEIAGYFKEGDRKVKEFLQLGWSIYLKKRKKSKRVEEKIGPKTTEFEKLVLAMPTGLLKKEFLERFRPKIETRITKKYKRMAEVRFAEYAKEDALDTLQLFTLLEKELRAEEKIWQWYQESEMPFALSVMESEILGVPIDVVKSLHLRREIRHLIEFREAEIKKEVLSLGVGDDFKVTSHVQIKDLVWNRLKLTPPSWAPKGKNGVHSTNKEVMNFLGQQGHTLCQSIAEFSGISNLYSTFLHPIADRASSSPTGVIRTEYRTVGARTGRPSSTPNFQNITNSSKMPIVLLHEFLKWRDIENPDELVGWKTLQDENTEGRRVQLEPIRSLFIAPPGYKMCVCDLSQIELRYLAVISGDPVLLNAYRGYKCECGVEGETNLPLKKCPSCGVGLGELDVLNPAQPVLYGFCMGLDVHCLTAEAVGLFSGLDPKVARNRAKAINFGLCYGMEKESLAKELGVEISVAAKYRQEYFKKYMRVRLLHEEVERRIKTEGEFTLLSGRKRRFFAQRDLIKRGVMKQGNYKATIREAVNNIVQGNAADHLKLAVRDFIRRKRELPRLCHAYMTLNVHDEIVVLAKEEYIEDVRDLLVKCMEESVKLPVPVQVGSTICDSWDQAK